MECDAAEESCDWKGKVRQLDIHKWEPNYLPMPCNKGDQLSHHLDNSCPVRTAGTKEQYSDVLKDGSSIGNTASVHSQADTEECDSQPLRHDIKTHSKDGCSREVIPCTNVSFGCTWRGKQSELSMHTQICDFEFIQCPNSCGNLIQRFKLAIHLRDQCPNQILPCPNTRAGCEWSGKQTELTTHKQNCHLESIRCPYQCGEMVSRQNLEHHITECPKRSVQCPNEKNGCIWMGKLEDINIHKEVCTHHKQKCPNKCGAYFIKQEDIEIHKSKDCPKRKVSCDNSSLGCCWKGLHCDLGVHKQVCDSRLLQYLDSSSEFDIQPLESHRLADQKCETVVNFDATVVHELNQHVHRQTYDFTQCPNSCGNPIKSCELATHLSDQCPNRILPYPNTGTGCDWSGKQTELTTHKQTCSFESIQCPYQCGEVISRQNLEHHIIECPERSIQYPNNKNGCIWMGKLKDVSIHETACTHHTRKCPKKCGAYFTTQEDIEIHINKDCPKRKVSCDNSSQGCHWKGPRCELVAHKQVCDSRLLQCLDSSSELNQQSDIKDDVTNESTKRAVQNAVLVEERGTDPVGLRPSDRKYKCDVNFDATIVQELDRHVTIPPLLIFLNKKSAQGGATCVTHTTSARIDLSTVKKCFKDTDLQKSTTAKFKQTTRAKLHKKEEKELALDMQQLVVTKVKKESMDSEQSLFHLESMRDGRKNNRIYYLTSKFEISIVKLDPTEIEFFPFPNNFMIQDTTTYLNQTNQQKSLLSWFQACLLQMMTKSQPLVTVNKFVESWTSLYTFGGDKMRKLFAQFTYLMLRSHLELRTSKNGHALGNLFKVWVDFIDLFLHSEDDGGDKVTDELVSLALDYLSDPSEQISIFTSNTSNSTLALKDMKHHFYYGGTNEAVLSLPSSKTISGCQYQHVQKVSVKHFNIMSAIALKKNVHEIVT